MGLVRFSALLAVGVLSACWWAPHPSAHPPTKASAAIPRAVDPADDASRIAAKRAFARSYRAPPVAPMHWDFGLRRHDSQAPIASADLLPTSQWIGTNGPDVLEVYAGAYGRDNPNEGAILVLAHDAQSAHVRRARLTPFPPATRLHIDAVDSYGQLRLTDASGATYALNATKDPPHLTRT